jgi:transposase-like protein
MPCPHCGTHDSHYWTVQELRWKCKGCGKRFSVTSGTVMADRKLPLTKVLKMALSWANGASGKPALQLRRDWNVSYKTAFTLAHKLREGLLRGFNVGFLCGVQEMDGMDANGRRYREKRNKPQGGGGAGAPKMPEHLLKPKVDPETGEIVGPPKPPKWDKKKRQPSDRRIILVARQRSPIKGKGGVATRIAVALGETTATVTTLAKRFLSAESSVMSDEDPAYAGFAKLFAKHQTVAHSKAYSLPGGISGPKDTADGQLAVHYTMGSFGTDDSFRFDFSGMVSNEASWLAPAALLAAGLLVLALIRGTRHARHTRQAVRPGPPGPRRSSPRRTAPSR